MNRRELLKRAGMAAAAAGAGAVAVPALAQVTKSEPANVVMWEHKAPVLDQGDIGSCTGNAVSQWSNTDYAMGITKRKDFLTEADAVKIYSLATVLDGLAGQFPPLNTGSTGDAACDAAVKLGLLAGYRNIEPTPDKIIQALRRQPLIVGTLWMSGMHTPDHTGLVTPTGVRVGGHEYTILGFDIPTRVFTCLNSWSDRWGNKGRFRIKFNDLVSLVVDTSTGVTAPIARDF